MGAAYRPQRLAKAQARWSCWGATSQRSLRYPLAVGAPMAWQEVRKGRGKGGSGIEASLTAMRNSIAQLAASISTTYTVPLPRGRDTGKVVGKAMGREGNARRRTSNPPRGPHVPRSTFFLLCGILWLVIRQCCQRLLRPGRRQRKGQGPHVQSQLDQLRAKKPSNRGSPA